MKLLAFEEKWHLAGSALTHFLFSDGYPQHTIPAHTAKTCPQEDFYRSVEFLWG